MSGNNLRRSGGMTLIEIMVAMAILAIAAIGALGYQYHSATHNRIARLEMTATRTAQLLLEDWKGTGGLSNYDPRNLNIGFTKLEDSDIYRIVIDNLPMYAKLAYTDLDYDSTAGLTLREISVIVRWRRDLSAGMPTISDGILVLTTYVRLDG